MIGETTELSETVHTLENRLMDLRGMADPVPVPLVVKLLEEAIAHIQARIVLDERIGVAEAQVVSERNRANAIQGHAQRRIKELEDDILQNAEELNTLREFAERHKAKESDPIFLRCSWCDWSLRVGREITMEETDLLFQHHTLKVCPNHPIRVMEARHAGVVALYERRIAALRDSLEWIAQGPCCESPGCTPVEPDCDSNRAKGALTTDDIAADRGGHLEGE